MGNRKTIKAVICLLLAVFIAGATLTEPVRVYAATPSEKTVKKAYAAYFKEQLQNGILMKDAYYQLYDFNKDGIREMVITDISGQSVCYIYTYRKNKVVALVAEDGDAFGNYVGYIKGKKYVCCTGTGGADFKYCYIYKISNGKFKTVAGYKYDAGVCTKNGKKISLKKFNQVMDSITYKLGKKYTA
jgi:hypothetical protein